jgi:hypothetical protein
VRLILILFDFLPFLGYYLGAMGKRKNKRLPKAAEEAKAGGAAMANATRGRARVFKNRKKEADRTACRGKLKHEE